MIIKALDTQDYKKTWDDMRQFTLARTPETPDEIWVVEHPPVFTQGRAGKPEHILNSGNIPIMQSDRGGQVTYHGPGQLVVYPLVNIKRLGLDLREWVSSLENAVIALLKNYKLSAIARQDAPGIYIDNKKICSIGLRIRNGCSYHGIALNVDMDLEPFSRINPCGFSNLKMTQLKDLGIKKSLKEVANDLIPLIR